MKKARKAKMSTVSSHEESNAEDVDDLDNLVDGLAVEEEDDNQEQTEAVEVDGEGNPDDEAQEVPARADPKPKRVIKNPQPKLNAETLKGPRGIHTLPQVFEKVKFKGKGYEEQDLNLLMKTYEYWCHRLFPKFSFDDCLARIEKLGTKKPVQVSFVVYENVTRSCCHHSTSFIPECINITVYLKKHILNQNQG